MSIANWKELMDAVVAFVMGKTRYHRVYVYQVAKTDTNDTVSTVKRLDPLAELPDMIEIPKRYGSHGLSCASSAGALVGIAFEAGDPARPYVACYYTGADPKELTLDATDLIQIGTQDAPGGSGGSGSHADLQVHVGTNDLQPVARLGDLVNCGQLAIVSDSNTATVVYTNYTGVAFTLGAFSVVAGALVFTPNPATGGVAPMIGRIISGSTFLKSA